MIQMDLNADIGEIDGEAGRALDRKILDVVTSCNIACGGHAGVENSMKATLKAAGERGVSTGAHPSYPDRENFGRVSLSIPAEILKDSLTRQVQSLVSIAKANGQVIAHLKPHGALYNDAAKDRDLSGLICEVADEFNIPVVYGLPNSELQRAAVRAGLYFVAEGFTDRLYAPDGSLTPRVKPGAVLESNDEVTQQAVDLAVQGRVRASSGEMIDLSVQTLCLHGDTAGASDLAAAIRNRLIESGVSLNAISQEDRRV
jgi:Uncharacterized proteins, homologs of lactam utilization protein B